MPSRNEILLEENAYKEMETIFPPDKMTETNK